MYIYIEILTIRLRTCSLELLCDSLYEHLHEHLSECALPGSDRHDSWRVIRPCEGVAKGVREGVRKGVRKEVQEHVRKHSINKCVYVYIYISQ